MTLTFIDIYAVISEGRQLVSLGTNALKAALKIVALSILADGTLFRTFVNVCEQNEDSVVASDVVRYNRSRCVMISVTNLRNPSLMSLVYILRDTDTQNFQES